MSLDLTKLNEEQKEAVLHNKGPLLIVAGAGTGKTTVITQRIVNLVDKGLAKPDEILAVTFTEKAAFEMEERVDKLLDFGYMDLWISTFHAFCEKVLRENALAMDFSNRSRAVLWDRLKWAFRAVRIPGSPRTARIGARLAGACIFRNRL